MKLTVVTLGLAALLGWPSTARAQVPVARAKVVYLYRINGQKQMQMAIQAIGTEQPGSRIKLFNSLSNKERYVALIQTQGVDQKAVVGWSNNYIQRHEPNLPTVRAFVLEGTLLVGQPNLNVNASSFIQIEHLDSAPAKREAIPPLLQQLEQALKQQPGFKDLQVWTWNARPNHWTVIEVWDNPEATRKAADNPELERLWDALYANAAAPKSQGAYKLVEQVN